LLPAAGADGEDGQANSSPAEAVLSLVPSSWPVTVVDDSFWPTVVAPIFIDGGDADAWPPVIPTPKIDVNVAVSIPTIPVHIPGQSPPDASVIAPIVEVAVEIDTDAIRGFESLLTPTPDVHRAGRKAAVRPERASAPTNAPAAVAPIVAPAAAPAPETAEPARAGAGSSSRGFFRGRLPLEFPPLEARNSSLTGGGSAPTVLVFAFATLIGFFVLAAPGLGRRIRLARYPRPRGRDGSSIDRPG
jgi:hypothetical protein